MPAANRRCLAAGLLGSASWCAVLSVPLLGACLYLPPLGRRLDHDQLDSVEVGATTRAEILEGLGEPNVLQDDRFFLYRMTSGGAGTLLFFGYFQSGAFVPLGTNTVLLLVRFDADGRLLHAPEVEIGSLGGDWGGGFARETSGKTLPRRTVLDAVYTFWGATLFDTVAFSPTRDLLVAGDSKGRFWVLELAGQEHWSFDRGDFESLALGPRGDTLALIHRTVHLVDTSTWKLRLAFEGHGNAFVWSLRGVRALDFAPDGETVATGGLQGNLILWDAAAGEELATHAVHDGQVFSLDHSPDGALLATSGTDDAVRLWSVSDWQEVGAIEHRGVVCFSPDGETLAVHCGGHVELWSIVPGATPALGELEDVLLMPYFEPAQWFIPSSVVFSPDGRLLAASRGSAAIWEIDTSRQLWRHDPTGNRRHRGDGNDAIFELAFSPDGRQLATAGNDGVHLWDLESIRPIQSPPAALRSR